MDTGSVQQFVTEDDGGTANIKHTWTNYRTAFVET